MSLSGGWKVEMFEGLHVKRLKGYKVKRFEG